ncbi:LPS assembly lipoprotein LptE [Candidatus Profftia tarda]|nr:LPS assembly lipoprotein LptE [Candidatus Profftia tarda]
MRSLFKIFFLGMIVLNTSCGFHRYSNALVPNELRQITLDTKDPYGSLSRSIRKQLHLVGITIIDPKRIEYSVKKVLNRTKSSMVNEYNGIDIQSNNSDNIPSLRISSSNDPEATVSIFRDGKTAESQIILQVSAELSLGAQKLHTLNVYVYRSFFNNPLKALAKDAEQEIICQEMCDQAAKQLVHKLLFVYADKFQKNKNKVNIKTSAPELHSINNQNLVKNNHTEITGSPNNKIGSIR